MLMLPRADLTSIFRDLELGDLRLRPGTVFRLPVSVGARLPCRPGRFHGPAGCRLRCQVSSRPWLASATDTNGRTPIATCRSC